MDQPADPVSPQNAHIGCPDGWECTPCGRVLLQCPVRQVRVAVIGVLAQDLVQVPFAGDQHPVQALAAGAGDPALRGRVRPGRPHRRLDDPNANRCNTASNAAVNLVSRSRIRNLKPVPSA